MTEKRIHLVAVALMLTLTLQANENEIKREFTVTTIALDAQAEQKVARIDTNETHTEGATLEIK